MENKTDYEEFKEFFNKHKIKFDEWDYDEEANCKALSMESEEYIYPNITVCTRFFFIDNYFEEHDHEVCT